MVRVAGGVHALPSSILHFHGLIVVSSGSLCCFYTPKQPSAFFEPIRNGDSVKLREKSSADGANFMFEFRRHLELDILLRGHHSGPMHCFDFFALFRPLENCSLWITLLSLNLN